jgi:hypothetical protein
MTNGDKVDFDKLDFRANFDMHAARMVTGRNATNDLYFTNLAKEMHILSVDEGLMTLTFDSLNILSTIPLNERASYFFRFGVMRRTRMLMSSFRGFKSIIMPDRVVPLTTVQGDEVCRDLNSIYINIIGLLDNYAWVIVNQFGSDRSRGANRVSIGLFKPTVGEDSNLKPVSDALSPFIDWARDIKELRDPAAHRMPLYVPPGAFTEEQAATANRYDQLKFEALRAEDFEKLSDLRSARESIGTFVPIFLHDPKEKMMDIYPTIPQDIGTIVKIGRIVQRFMRDASR